MHSNRFSEMRPRFAVLLIATVTTVLVLVSGAIAVAFDREDFNSFGIACWWALQTVTTVGYGDVVPHTYRGRLIGSVVMVLGIGLSSVFTALITSALFQGALRRRNAGPDAELKGRLDAIEGHLATLAAAAAKPGE